MNYYPPRISLRVLLVGTLVVGVAAGMYVRSAILQRRAVDDVTMRGGQVFYSFESEPGRPQQQRSAGLPAYRWMSGQAARDFVYPVVSVRFTAATFSSGDLSCLARLASIQELRLKNAAFGTTRCRQSRRCNRLSD